MGDCRCGCNDGAGAPSHAVAAALADGDVDGAIGLGLLDAAPCPGCAPACSATLVAARDDRHGALAARERYRARTARLQRRAAERAQPPLPPAAAAALARALARAGTKP